MRERERGAGLNEAGPRLTAQLRFCRAFKRRAGRCRLRQTAPCVSFCPICVKSVGENFHFDTGFSFRKCLILLGKTPFAQRFVSIVSGFFR